MKTRIKEYRRQRGWTQEDLGDRIGASKAHVSEMEGGKKNPSTPLMERIAQVFGVRVSDLFEDVNADTADLMRDYEALPPEDRAAIRDLARRLASRAKT
jgi:putative transcriptional regulator